MILSQTYIGNTVVLAVCGGPSTTAFKTTCMQIQRERLNQVRPQHYGLTMSLASLLCNSQIYSLTMALVLDCRGLELHYYSPQLMMCSHITTIRRFRPITSNNVYCIIYRFKNLTHVMHHVIIVRCKFTEGLYQRLCLCIRCTFEEHK